jgi:hypothetical protein
VLNASLFVVESRLNFTEGILIIFQTSALHMMQKKDSKLIFVFHYVFRLIIVYCSDL